MHEITTEKRAHVQCCQQVLSVRPSLSLRTDLGRTQTDDDIFVFCTEYMSLLQCSLAVYDKSVGTSHVVTCGWPFWAMARCRNHKRFIAKVQLRRLFGQSRNQFWQQTVDATLNKSQFPGYKRAFSLKLCRKRCRLDGRPWLRRSWAHSTTVRYSFHPSLMLALRYCASHRQHDAGGDVRRPGVR